eukprot:TRINITY_DN8408_c0_g1_i1.p1 TRINITY_DN8408_c0_g1~~TRINITY_DN8408_c0_g1_i1.p1  ORF type:complete len:550 (+),score=132.24 TRINITY_DN8408_c0_g1_i1:42-1652(+)
MAEEITKEELYDRQLRLWGTDGQRLLGESHICLLNGGGLGTETMKNLVLPGIGKFTIVDAKDVCANDLGNNFFVELSSLGKNRAEVTAELLHELNDFVETPTTIQKDPLDIINGDDLEEFVKNYTVIIATEVPETECIKLADACLAQNVSLVVVRANGYLGYIRIVSNEHTVILSKEDFPKTDLRLNHPFQELQNFADSLDLESIQKDDPMVFAHIPFPVILIKKLQEWKDSHDGNTPKTNKEKDEFKTMVLKVQDIHCDGLNFEEARSNSHKAYNAYEIPSDVEDILNDPKATNLTSDSDIFWITVNAVSKFKNNEGNGYLPLLGIVPDMTATSQLFIKLQEVYETKAQQDQNVVANYVRANLVSLSLPEDYISEEYIGQFCQNVFGLKVVRFRTYEEEFNNPIMDNLFMSMLDPMTFGEGNGYWYLSLRAAEVFRTNNGRYPGENTDNYAEDSDELKLYAQEIVSHYGLDDVIVGDNYCLEICRYGNSQLHSIVSFLGGVASLEVIKLITHQFVPLNHTMIYNAINSTSCRCSH